jgi:isocitrate/isopropylmalate dehydrogenase
VERSDEANDEHHATRQQTRSEGGDRTMTRRPRYVVACLTGNGIGPEVMAEASRALAEVSSLHGFCVDEVHPPFAGEAMTRDGHPLPPATRRATLAAETILVAGSTQPAP